MDKRIFTRKQVIESTRDYVLYLKNKYKLKIEAVYLYGSYAKRKQKNWSDVDICIISTYFKGRIDPISFLWKNLREKDVESLIEPIGFHPKNFTDENPLAWEIKKYGEEIKMQD
jgi:predicted nucleotidyltransferase